MKTIVATVLLALAVASPALAQSAQSQQCARSGQNGTYQGYPTSEWQRPDSW
jgi:opacity protein-like surface antigen